MTLVTILLIIYFVAVGISLVQLEEIILKNFKK